MPRRHIVIANGSSSTKISAITGRKRMPVRWFVVIDEHGPAALADAIEQIVDDRAPVVVRQFVQQKKLSATS